MEQFLVLYRAPQSAADQMASSTPEEMKASMDEWMAWGAAAGDALVDWGRPTQPASDNHPGPAGWVSGYSIIQAADNAGALELLAGHPHNKVGSIELLKMLPMPGGS